MRDALQDIPEPSQAALSLARSIAIASMRIEAWEQMTVEGKAVDDALFVRVCGQLSRSIVALRAMKQPEAAARAANEGALNLQKHLQELARKGKAAALSDGSSEGASER